MAEAGWQKSLDEFKALYEQIQVQDGVVVIPPAVATRIAQVTANDWDNNRFIFTFGQLDAEKSGHLARAGVIEWWHALNGHTFFGNLDGIRTVYAMHSDDAGGKAEKLNLGASMSWGSYPYKAGGVESKMDEAVLRQLFDWGAKPSYEKNKYYKLVLQGSPKPIIRQFIERGADAAMAEEAVTELLGKKDYTQAMRVNEALGRDGFYTKIDDSTIMQTKFIMTPVASTLKTIFNFGARRINEIYEMGTGKEASMTMTSSNFEQYDSTALRRAQETLEKLGGNPPDVLDKPKLAALKNG